MQRTNSRSRRKLMVSLAVLAMVFIVAAVAQFTGRPTANPYKDPVAEQPSLAPEEDAQQRPVFGDRRPAPTDSSPRPSPSAVEGEPNRNEESQSRTRTTTTAEDRRAAPEGLNEVLDQWRESIMNGDVDAQVNLYAPKMDRFFTKRNVSKDDVRRETARMMKLYPDVSRYEISDIQVESNTGDEAVVSFRKEWDMKGDKRFAGAERQRLKLRKFAGDWKIVSEEETKVYWVKRA